MYLSNRFIIVFALAICIITISVTFGLLWIFDSPDPSTLDSDRDGYTDDIDLFPDDPQVHNDSDEDGIGDNLDKFPFDPAASIDTDNDGYPDKWNNEKTEMDSTSQPRLQRDEFPCDPTEWNDSDDDGVGDNSDIFPHDSTESRDDDGDGIGNNADHNPFVDLSFSLSIHHIVLRKHVDLLPWAQVYIKIFVDGEELKNWDNDGKYYYIWKNRPKTIESSLFFDIAETGSKNVTEIEIQLFDHDILKEDSLIDINKANDKTTISLRVYHETNTIIPSSSTMGDEATIDYQIILPDEIQPSDNIIEKNYEWIYKGQTHTLSLAIPKHKYEWAMQSVVNRSPQSVGHNANEAMAHFVTCDDSSIRSLATSLETSAQNHNYNRSETIDFVMSFVQQTIFYREDNSSKHKKEYWRYPIETLVDEQGDCEDTSVLFASIIENMDNYEAVLLFYIIEDDIGHLATGVSGLPNFKGDFVTYQQERFYYCETTSITYTVGKKPKDIPDVPEGIIPIQ